MFLCVPGLVILFVTSFFIANSWPAHAYEPGEQGFRRLKGWEIRKAFVGKNFTDETHYSNYYRADGTIDEYSMGKKLSNTWKVTKDDLCITDSFGEFCYAVWKKGVDVQLVQKDFDITLYGSLK